MGVVLDCMKTKGFASILEDTDDVMKRNTPNILDNVHHSRLKTLDVSENECVFFLWFEGVRESIMDPFEEKKN
jgi:hypothetical protein